MTVRDYLDRTARGFAKVMAAGFGLSVAVAFAWQLLGLPDEVMVVAVGGFLMAWVTLWVVHLAGIRCPVCGQRLEQFYRVRLFWSADIRYCPRCGVDLDRPLGQPSATEPSVAPARSEHNR